MNYFILTVLEEKRKIKHLLRVKFRHDHDCDISTNTSPGSQDIEK